MNCWDLGELLAVLCEKKDVDDLKQGMLVTTKTDVAAMLLDKIDTFQRSCYGRVVADTGCVYVVKDLA